MRSRQKGINVKAQMMFGLAATLAVGALGGMVLPGSAGGQGAGWGGPKPWEMTIRVKGIPSHEQIVRIDEVTPYVVPANKVLVVTWLGATSWVNGVQLLIDGQVVVLAQFDQGAVTGNPKMDPGMVAYAGQTVAVNAERSWAGPLGVALGYLDDA
ncbi:MAG: hypothetical protein DWP92_05105 [Armatimonadetes bacterium]|nr:MAG: hypothetical protein DWP92_05105 [Armatimonadota bacterium]